MRLEINKTVPCRLPISRLNYLMRAAVRPYDHKLLAQELSVVVVDDRTMRKINRIYAKKNTATDVLSFDYGEIIINYSLAVKQARQHGLTASREIALLFTHGLLHILGFDHKRAKDKKRMRLVEEKLLGYGGLMGRGKR